MGMYDEISPEISQRVIKTCPYCYSEFRDDYESYWQTKDFDNLLKVLSLEDVSNQFEMHHICDKCNRYMSVIVDMDNGFYKYRSREDDYSKWHLFNDTSLVNDYAKLHFIDKDLKSCIESLSLGNNYSDNLILQELFEKYYIIPKEKVEKLSKNP